MKKRALALLKAYASPVVALAAAAGLAVLLYWPSAPPIADPGSTRLAMASKTENWSKTEHDATRLLADLQAKNIAAIGVAPAAILVSTKTAENYFVSDARGVLAAMLVKTVDDSPGAFSLAVLPHVGLGLPSDTMETVRTLAGLLVPLLMIGLMARHLRQETTSLGKFAKAPDGISFESVVGADEAKNALKDVIAYLKDPAKYAALGARPPKGTLLLGSSGVGKTLLVQAMAGEARVPVILVSGSDFSSKYFGTGVAKVRHLFSEARKHAPCIVLIDEADGLGRRTGGSDAGSSEMNRIVNAFLVELDGFEAKDGVVIVAATNLAENLDPAFLREGRFDRRVHVRMPDVAGRAEILKRYAAKLPLAGPVDYGQLSRLTVGLSPATLAQIVNHAAMLAARAGAVSVSMANFIEAVETSRIGELTGGERALTSQERYRLAAHEGGHGLKSVLLNTGVVEKITILPRGGALGVTLVTQAEDMALYPQSFLENRIQVLLAGRAAEILLLGEASTGAAEDLKEASRLAFEMVSRFGLGPNRRLFSLGSLPSELAGPAVEAAVQEAEALLASLAERCMAQLVENRSALERLAAALMDRDTIEGPDVLRLVFEAQSLATA